MKYEVMMLRERYETIADAVEAFKELTLPYQEEVIREAIRWEMGNDRTPIPDAVTMFITRSDERGAEFLESELLPMLDVAWDTHRPQGTPTLGLRITDRAEDRVTMSPQECLDHLNELVKNAPMFGGE